jgi:hypothetical protein
MMSFILYTSRHDEMEGFFSSPPPFLFQQFDIDEQNAYG